MCVCVCTLSNEDNMRRYMFLIDFTLLYSKVFEHFNKISYTHTQNIYIYIYIYRCNAKIE